MIYGVILVYYEKYHVAAVNEFKKILDSVDPDNKLVVVTNNPKLISPENGYILGNDLESEFSGYDVGIGRIKDVLPDGHVIIANDTFCHHRHWGAFERRTFVKAIKAAREDNVIGIVGEVDTFRKKIQILGLESTSWVSTYLFLASVGFLASLNWTLSINKATAKKLIGCDSHNQLIWNDAAVGSNVITQLTKWLSEDNRQGWRNRSASAASKIIKIRAILNEFYVSACAEANGFKVGDVYDKLNFLDRATLKYVRVLRYLKMRFGLSDAR